MRSQHVVLAVDLDGTLIRSDLLHENILFVLSRRIRSILHVVLSLFWGKAAFKAALSELFELDASRLPYRAEVLSLIERFRKEGQPVILVSASNQRLVDRVSSFLGCFDAAYGSDDRRNLGGASKADFLVSRYGRKGFDYIGDATTDLPVWADARRAITVAANGSLRRKVDTLAEDVEHIASDPWLSRAGDYVRALRPHQWVKNILVFVPLAAAHRFQAAELMIGVVAFVAFSLTASSVYIVNDLLDLEADRAHPRKCNRPFASGAVPISHGFVLAAVLLAVATLLSLLLMPAPFIAVLALYYGATLAYSFSLKRKMIIDICTLAGLYTLRVLGGAQATGTELSPWLVAFSMFLFLSLAALKRQTELISGMESGRLKVAGRNYEVGDLPVIIVIAVASGFNAVMVLALYFNSPDVHQLYSAPMALWGICPILLYWIGRLVMLTQRGYMADDPIVFAMRDGVSLACGALVFACAATGVLL